MFFNGILKKNVYTTFSKDKYYHINFYVCVCALNRDVKCIYFLICVPTYKGRRNIAKNKLKSQVTDWENIRNTYKELPFLMKKSSNKLRRKMTQ